MNRTMLGLVLAVISSNPASATTYTADSRVGSDGNPGTSAQPFRSIGMCISQLRQPGDVCELRSGVYDAGGVVSYSGTAASPLIIRARSGDTVIVRQGAVPAWTNAGGNLWSASFDYTSLLTAQRANTSYYERGIRLWQDGVPLTEACFPNLPASANGIHPTLLSESGTSNTVVTNAQIPSGDLRGARAVVFPYLRQLAETRRVNSSGTGLVNIGTGYFLNEPGKPFYLEGSKALIDQDGEWAWDEPTGMLWIQMPSGVDPNTAKVRIQSSSTAFTLQGSNYVTISGIQFQGVVPVATTGTTGVIYDHINVFEAGILRFADAQYDFTQLAGLVVRDGAKVTHSVIDGCSGRCIDVAGSNVLVEHTTVRNGARLGQYEGAISICGKNASIVSNRIENSGRDGVAFQVTGVENSIVRRNWILNCGLQSYDAAGVILGAHPNGPVTIDSNLVVNTSKEGSGIFIDESSTQNKVDHNVIGGTTVGIMAEGNLSKQITTFANNAIWNNTILPGVPASFGIRAITTLSSSQFSDNVTTALPVFESILPSSFSSRVSSPSEYTGWGATWSGNLEAGIDPLVKSVATQDFGLQSGSPAIDIGVVGAWSYSGAKPDAGAVESGTKQWIYGPYDIVTPPSNPTFGFEDLSKWNPPSWDNVAYTKSLSTDHVEGNYSLAVTSGAFKELDCSPLSQSDVGGWGSIKWNLKINTPMPNPYWVGQVQVIITCPSLNLWNAWIGQIDLTGLPQQQWLNLSLPIPSNVSGILNGAKYTDLRVGITFNMTPGQGSLLFDNMRIVP